MMISFTYFVFDNIIFEIFEIYKINELFISTSLQSNRKDIGL